MALQGVGGPRSVAEAQQRVDHDIADTVDAVFGYVLGSKILVGADIGGEQQVGDGIGGDAGDLLRHGSVVGA